MSITTIAEVVGHHLCCGCGACAYLAPGRFAMVDVVGSGRRPRTIGEEPAAVEEREAVEACPGRHLAHSFDRRAPGLLAPLGAGWGPVRGIWEGYAADPEIRHRGSSGGVATAIARFGIERGGMAGVLQTRMRVDAPHLNETVLNTTAGSVLESAGSRYSPASPCEALDLVERAPGPCVFVGKPCDVAATAMVRGVRRALDDRVGLTVGIFCAGTPSTQATENMLREVGISDFTSITSLRYRGMGWPGTMRASFHGAAGDEVRELSYEDAWGRLQAYRPWRCYLCIDHTGEFADLSVGDPWYRPREADPHGRSLVVERSERGGRVLRAAVAAGYVILQTAPADALPRSQPGFLPTRGKVWARLAASRLLGEPAPVYRNMPMARFWLANLRPGQQLRAFVGTTLRILGRRRRRQRTAASVFADGPASRHGKGTS